MPKPQQPSAEERQAFIDIISEADLAKIQAKTEKTVRIEIEDIVEAEFLMKFGFEAYWALYPEKDRTKGISSKEMVRLLFASRKIDAQHLYSASQAAFIGAAAGQSGKKASSVFNSATRKILKQMEADK